MFILCLFSKEPNSSEDFIPLILDCSRRKVFIKCFNKYVSLAIKAYKNNKITFVPVIGIAVDKGNQG